MVDLVAEVLENALDTFETEYGMQIEKVEW